MMNLHGSELLEDKELLEANIPRLDEVLLPDIVFTEKDKALLKEWENIFKRFKDKKIDLQQLRSMLALYSDENAEITLAGMMDGGKGAANLLLFNQSINMRSLIKMLVNRIKNRYNPKVKNPPAFHGKLDTKEKEKEKTQFSINEEELSAMRFNFAAREKKKRNKKQFNQVCSASRVQRYNRENMFNTSPAIVPTIMAGIKDCGYDLELRKFNLSKQHLRYPVYQQEVDYNIMLVLDTSNSTQWVVPHIEKFLGVISSNITQSRDRLGLITFSDDTAQIFHYPTMNVKQVIGTINTMKTSGMTPLADGLNLARQTLSRDQYNQIGTKNIILLISDCYPEPVKGGFKNLLDEPCYKDSIKAAELIKQQKIRFIIINPAPPTEEGKKSWGQKLAHKMRDSGKAKYLELHPQMIYSILGGEKSLLDETELNSFFTAVNELKME